ncbi:hypothetical protein V5799_018640 [Amblyomma americanum]|uniref:Uncharacterized protein n=1 Tax=Amblyomma americanum TaxID=6943 RepID=A0AAQ4EZ49_AMBAM
MLFPTTLTPFSSPNSSPPLVHHHLRSESSSGASKYHSAEQYEPRRPSVSQYGSEVSRPLRREPQHIYGSLSKSPYGYAPGSPLDMVDKRPQEVSYDVPPVVPDSPPRFLYERPLVDHERPHGRPLTSIVEPPQYSEHGRERPQIQSQQTPHHQAQTLYGSPKFTSSQLRSSGQYQQVVTEKPTPQAPPAPPSYVRPVKYSNGSPSQSPSSSGSGSVNGGGATAADEVYGVQPPSSGYHHRGSTGGSSRPEMAQHQPESRVPDQDEQQPPSRKLHPQAEASPLYTRYSKNSQENTRMEDAPSAEKQTPSYQSYPVGLYGGGSSDGGRNTRRRYNLVYIPVDVLKKLLTEAGYRKKK